MRRIVPTLVMAGVVLAGPVACGGQNTEALRRDAVGCSTYFTVLNAQILEGDPAFADRIMAALVDPAAVDADARSEEINRTLVEMSAGTDAWRAELPPEELPGAGSGVSLESATCEIAKPMPTAPTASRVQSTAE